MASFFSIHDADQLATARRRTRKRIAIIFVSSIVLVSVVIAIVAGTSSQKHSDTDSKHLSSSIKAVCNVTLHPDLCYNTLGNQAGEKTTPQDLFKLSMQIALSELSEVSTKLKTKFTGTNSNDTMSNAALQTCFELLEMSTDHLNASVSVPMKSFTKSFDDLRTWLSTAGTCLETCLDGFVDINNPTLHTELNSTLKNTTELTSNSLAIVTWISSLVDSVNFGQRKMLNVPIWVHRIERQLLESPELRKKADIIVAKDGTGKYKTISDALKAVPDKSTKMTVIYVKKGVYSEYVIVSKSKWNVVFVGDGMDSTIITGSKNVVDGTPTFDTAPFAVMGNGLVVKDMGFRNTAGASKHQAVAMRSSGDFSVFHRCKFDAFQDTVYTHANRQFYRDCLITGTVDFIFGNSAAVFQNCNIQPRRPAPGQKNTITAQGKSDPNQNTGLSFQNCSITPFDALGNIETYLGRPWKDYSTTLFMNSFMTNLVHPKGWLPWTGNDAPSTIFYGEYLNSGPGASTKNRVKWKGLRTITAAIAKKFTVDQFVGGSKWIINAGVPVKGGL